MCLLFCRKDRRSVLNNSICFFVEIFNVTIRSLSFKEIEKISSCGRLSRAQSALLPASGSSTASNSPAPPPLITSDLQLPLRSTLHKPSGLSDIGIRLRDSIAESCDRSRTTAGTARCQNSLRTTKTSLLSSLRISLRNSQQTSSLQGPRVR